MKRYKLYLFDFDGTLLNTMSALEYVFSVSYEHIGMKFDPKDTVEFARIPLSESYKKMNGDPAKWQEFIDYIHAALDFPKALEANEPYEESLEFLFPTLEIISLLKSLNSKLEWNCYLFLGE